MQNSIPALTSASRDGVAGRIARHTVERRVPDYAEEVRRLLDAGLAVMRRCGTTSRPRVADIVAEAGLSNETFYRHFPSKDALVVAILEDGTERLASYLAHQMAKESTPEGKIRSWIEGVLSQAVDEDVAAATRAVLWNAASVIGDAVTSGQPAARATLASLLHEPLGALGSDDPGLHAWLIGHAVVGALSDHLLRTTRPSPDEVERIVRFCLDAVVPRRMRRLRRTASPPAPRPRRPQ